LGASTSDVLYVNAGTRPTFCFGASRRVRGPGRLNGFDLWASVRCVYRLHPRLVEIVRRTRATLEAGDEPSSAAAAAVAAGTGMKVFYHCYGSSHTSVVASAIHTGRLDPRITPTLRKIISLEPFDRTGSGELGTLYEAGTGPAGEGIYFIGLGPARKTLCRAILSFLDLRRIRPRDYLFADALSPAGLTVRAGGILSRRFGLVSAGRPLAALGIRLAYPRLAALVTQTQAEVRRRLGLTELSAGR
jgi:hypothetical protein